MPQAATDRNLLFGIMALQMDFIDRDALVRAMNAWVLEKSRSLGQVLVEQGALAADTHALLEALVVQHLRRHGDDPARSLAAVRSPAAVGAELGGVADPDVQASLAHVTASGSTAGGDDWATRAPESVGRPTSSGQRFRVLRPHARGGLGEVFVALDEELRREVALKEIQDRHADDPDSRARFLLEAEITGGLEHPGVVPVYGLGKYPDGRPYYAMRFIRGDSLKEAIERYHAGRDGGPAPGERAVQFRKLLGRFVDVCNAIEYAHSRGVLHRDLKPGNVMLGKYGETLVVDWGLAKPLAASAGAPARSLDEQPLRPTPGGSSQTVAGSAVGTPQFMSPEQAAGRLDELGPASDVYSLGATLYALLTGRPPFEGADVGGVLRQVEKGDFPPPRRVKGDVPAALEAVCLKAMARRPEDRYPSARALADDVEHWLADEPVSAFREPWPARTGRWARRHRTAVTAAAVALLVALAGLATATLLLGAANDRERAARALAQQNADEARTQRDRARQRFLLARQAVDRFHTQVSESPEMKAKGTEQLRHKLLETAVEFYQQFVDGVDEDDPILQNERGNSYRRLARLCGKIGRPDEAEKAYRSALNIQKHLVARHPDDEGLRHDLALTCQGLALLYYDVHRFQAAEEYFKEGLALHEQRAAERPADPVRRDELARLHTNLANLYNAADRTEPAEKHYLAALDILRALVKEHPGDPAYEYSLAKTEGDLGILYEGVGRLGDTEKAYQESVAVLRRLSSAHPDMPDVVYSFALRLQSLGWLYGNTRRIDQAAEACREAQSLFRELAQAHPSVTQYQTNLIDSYLNLGDLLRRGKRLGEAADAHRQALEAARRLAAAYPKDLGYQATVGACHHNLGLTYEDQRRDDLAEKEYQEAVRLRRPFAEAHPDLPGPRGSLAWSYHNLGEVCARLDRLPAAREAYEPALKLAQELTASHPDMTEYGVILGSCRAGLGDLEVKSGRPEAGVNSYTQALQTLEGVLRTNRHDPTARKYQRSALRGRAAALDQLGRHAEAAADRALAAQLAASRRR